MSDYFKLTKIDDKGFGCIATKDIPEGTLILREKAQIFDNGGDPTGPDVAGWIKSVMTSFNQMNEDNQKEFLTLHNDSFQDLSQSQKNTQDLDLYRRTIRQIYGHEQDRDKILKIICIFVTNLWMGKPKSVEIHCARFNHSCRPNVRIWLTSNNEYLVRTIGKIKDGEEITFAYGPYVFMVGGHFNPRHFNLGNSTRTIQPQGYQE